MVAAEAFTPLQSIAASAFAAYELMLGLTLHQLFADETPLAIEARMAAAGAERVAGVADRCRQSAAAFRVAAHVPHRGFGEFRHVQAPSVPASFLPHRLSETYPY